MAGDELDGRGEPRTPCSLSVHLTTQTDSMLLTTANASATGVFLRAGVTLELGTLVRLRITLRQGEPPLVVTGRVVHATDPDVASDGPPGIGVRLVKMSEDARTRWEGFLASLKPAPPPARRASGRTSQAATRVAPKRPSETATRVAPPLPSRPEEVTLQTKRISEEELAQLRKRTQGDG